MWTELHSIKVELLSEGILIKDRARAEISSQSNRISTGEYASTSGAILRLGENIFINTPFQDKHSNIIGKSRRYYLDFDGHSFWVRSLDGQINTEAQFVAPPKYIDKLTTAGVRKGDIGNTHTDRVRIAPIENCAWVCQFCDVPYNKLPYKKHNVKDILEVVQAALNDKRAAQHLLISGGTPIDEDFDYLLSVYEAVIKANPGLEVDVMMAPAVADNGRNLLVAKDLKAMGVHEVSANVELYNQEIARKVIPQKAELGWDHYVEFLKSAVKEFGWGNARTIFVFGIEPVEDTLKGIEAMAQIGVVSEISPLIPDPSTPLVKVKNMTTPSATAMREVYERAREIADKYDVLMGAKCVPCMHNVLDFPDMDGYRTVQYDRKGGQTIYTPVKI